MVDEGSGWQRKRCSSPLHCIQLYAQPQHSARPVWGAPVRSWRNPDAALKLFKENTQALQQGFGQWAVFSFHHPTDALLRRSLSLSALVPACSCQTKPPAQKPPTRSPGPSLTKSGQQGLGLPCNMWHTAVCATSLSVSLRCPSKMPQPWVPCLREAPAQWGASDATAGSQPREPCKGGHGLSLPPPALLVILTACPHSPVCTQEWFPREASE